MTKVQLKSRQRSSRSVLLNRPCLHRVSRLTVVKQVSSVDQIIRFHAVSRDKIISRVSLEVVWTKTWKDLPFFSTRSESAKINRL